MIDLLLVNGHVITMDSQRRIIPDGCVAIDEGKIIEVGETDSVSKKYTAKKTIDCMDHVVMPGFVDAHGHGGHNGFKSIVKDTSYWMPVMTHLYKTYVTDEYWYHEAKLSALHRLQSGVTTGVSVLGSQPRCDDPVFALNYAKGYNEIGVKPIICTGPCSLPWPHSFGRIVDGKRVIREVSYEEVLQSLETVIGELHNSNQGKVKAYVAPFGVITSIDPSAPTPADRCVQLSEHDRMQAKEMRRIAEKFSTRIHTDAFGGMVYLANQDREHALLGPDVHLQHCTGLSMDEVVILAESGTRVSYAPNMEQFKARTPVLELMELGVTVAMATDGAMLSSSFDMFQMMNRGQQIERIQAKDDFVLPSEKVLEMATIDAAKCIGLEREIGSLERGKKADVVTINIMAAHLMPRFNVIDTLIGNANSADISHVVVEGDVLKEKSVIHHVQEREILLRIESEVQETIKRSGLESFAYPQNNNWGKTKLYFNEYRFDLEENRKDGGSY